MTFAFMPQSRVTKIFFFQSIWYPSKKDVVVVVVVLGGKSELWWTFLHLFYCGLFKSFYS